MADLVGVTLTTSAIREITGNLKTISEEIEDTTKNFNNTMKTLTGQAEGGLIEQTTTAAEQLYDGVIKLSKCFLDLGIHIGDYLKMMLTHDSEQAQRLREQIER